MKRKEFILALNEEEFKAVMNMRTEEVERKQAEKLLEEISFKMEKIQELGYEVVVNNHREHKVSFWGIKLQKIKE